MEKALSMSSMDELALDSEVVLEVECNEKDGVYLRRARRLEQVPDDMALVFNKLRGLPSMFSSVPMNSMEPIIETLNKGWKVLLVDDVGLLAIGTTRIDDLIDVHITFWDRILRGRERLAMAAILWAMAMTGSKGVWTAIPSSSKATIAFAKRVGFVLHGWLLNGARDREGNVDDSVVMYWIGH